jgi:MFS-type transporter involved in bile tolerance (Atg22 family)
MLAVAFIAAVAMPHGVMEDATLATVVALVAALLWFVITFPLCWLSVKALMRSTSENVSVEQGYRLGESSV